MTARTLSEISCPLCKKIFRVKKGKPRTLKQWEVSLMNHLIASHHLGIKEAEAVVNSYLNKIH